MPIKYAALMEIFNKGSLLPKSTEEKKSKQKHLEQVHNTMLIIMILQNVLPEEWPELVLPHVVLENYKSSVICSNKNSYQLG